MAGDSATGVSIMRAHGRASTAGRYAWRRASRSAPQDTYGTLAQRLQRIGGELLVRALDESPAVRRAGRGAGHLRRQDHRRRPAARSPQARGRARADRPCADAAHRRLRRARGRDAARGPRARVGRAAGRRGRTRRERCRSTARCRCSATADGTLELVVVQPPGKRPMPGGDYLRGRRMSPRRRGQAPRRLPGASVRLHGRSQGVRAGGLRRPRARGRGPGAGPTRPGVRDGARLRRRAAAHDAGSRGTAVRPAVRWSGSTRRCSRRCVSGSSSCSTSAASPTTRRSTSPSSSPSARAAAARASSTRSSGARPRRARRSSQSSTTPIPRAPRSCTRCRTGWRELWWAELGRRASARAAAGRQRARRVRDPRQHAGGGAADVAAALPVPSHPAPGLPEGLVVDGGVRRPWLRPVGAGAIMPQSRGSMLVARALAPVAGSACSTCAPLPAARRRTSRRCSRTEARSWPSSAIPDVRRAAANVRADARELRARRGGRRGAVEPRRRRRRFDRVLVDPPCSGLGTLQSRPDRRWRASPRRSQELADVQSRILARRCGLRRARRDARLLGLHDLPAGGGDGGRAVPARASGIRARGPRRAAPDWRGAAVDRTCKCCPAASGTDGFFIARCRRLRGPR